jgi:SAM-dependent methyltransferase
MTGVTHERWQDAHEAERGFWSTRGFGLGTFADTVRGCMHTAAWTRSKVTPPAGDWLEIGVGPLGVGCTHFLDCKGTLNTLDPIEPTAVEEWQLPEACRALIRHCQQHSTIHVGQAERLEFADGAFTLVASENMLDHVEDPDAVLREARRVLKPGGLLLVAVDTFSALGEARYQLLTRRHSDTIVVRAHPHRFSAAGLTRLVAGAGFRIAHAVIPSRSGAIAGRHHRTRLLAVSDA